MEFRYNDLHLRSSTEGDIEFVTRLEGAKENSPFITFWSHEQHREAFRDKNIWHAIISVNGHDKGFIILAGLENSHRSIEFMRIVIAEKEKGLGRLALQAVKKFCFEDLKAHRLWLDVKTFNNRALNLYQSEGFVVEGTLRDCLRVGEEYQSLTLLSTLESEYRQS